MLSVQPPPSSSVIQITQVKASREELPILYADVVNQNPLLGRIEGQAKLIGWSDEEIRTMQLLAACRSNASLTQRLKELESMLSSKGTR